ncbi:hypothetical protein [Streptomyces sp. NPDC093544]|jgi:hypothetical protein|uniref:hypothetical protein n=1 Tax=Streptomyces sp. NPDC093544 TaxID=3155200 RepID=UPI00342B9713
MMKNPRSLLRLIAVAAAVAVTAIGIAVPAQAAPGTTVTFANSFEGNPWNDWQGLASGDGVAGADVNGNPVVARSGVNNGWLYTGNGWAAEKIAVTIGSWGNRSNCSASIWANPVSYGAGVGLEVWDPNGANGWVKLTSTAPGISAGSYQQITTAPLNLNGLSTVYIQAIYGNNNGVKQFVRIDDVSLTCVS